MKHCFTILCFVFSILSSVFCQKAAIVIDERFDKIPIVEVFDILQIKYDLQIAYDYDAVANIVIHEEINKQPLDLALEQLFEDTNLEYQRKEKRLFIRQIEATTEAPILQEILLQGKIIDSQTEEALEFATIFSKEANEGSSTDAKGPRTIVWTSKKDLKNLQIALEPKPLGFEEVTITEQLPVMQTSKNGDALVFNSSKLNTLPSFIGGRDVFRGIQLLPGIAADDDLSAELRIRGGTGDESMVIFDGITLYKTDHYFGIFSAVNSSIVNQANIYKNTFPVEYGGRTSGVVKMTLLLGGRITNKNVATTNLFSLLEQKTSAPNRTQNFIAGAGGNNNGNSAQQPGANNVSRNELLAYEPNFTFYDFNVKWAWNIRPTTRLSAHYFQGYDEFNYDYTQEYKVGAPKKRRTNVTETYTEAANWLNKGWSIQASEKWTDRFQSNINISQSGHQDEKLSTSTLNSFDTKRPLPSGKIVIAPNSEKTTINTNNNFNKIDGFDINFKNEWQIDEQQALTFGLNYINNKVVVDLVVDDESILDKKLNTNQQAAYAQYNFNSLDKKWKIGLGLRSTYYSTTNKQTSTNKGGMESL